jgi:hypothetical protein
MMKKCPSCDSLVDENAIFCFNCGYSTLTTEKIVQANMLVEKKLDLNLTSIDKFKHLQNQITGLLSIPEELESAKSYLVSLKDSFTDCQRRLHDLSQIRESEEKDVRKLENLTVNSLVARIKGDKEEKLEKERLELLNALNKEEAVKKEHDRLTSLLKDTETQIQDLTRLKQIKGNIQKDLRKFLDETCEGVTDPIEDEIEGRLRILKTSLHPIETQRGKIFRARNHLENAISDLQSAERELGGASGMANWDTFFGGGLIADSIKHSRMSAARDRVYSAQTNLKYAQSEYPNIPDLRGVHIEEISFFWDGFMDNIFSDLSARDKINRSRHSVQEALNHAQMSINYLNEEISKINKDFSMKTQEIREIEDQLYRERVRMIEETINK